MVVVEVVVVGAIVVVIDGEVESIDELVVVLPTKSQEFPNFALPFSM